MIKDTDSEPLEACARAEEVILSWVEPREDDATELHLASCERCRDLMQWVSGLAETASLPALIGPPGDLVARTLARLSPELELRADERRREGPANLAGGAS